MSIISDYSEKYARAFIWARPEFSEKAKQTILSIYLKVTDFIVNIVKFIVFSYILLEIVKPRIGFENTIIILLLGLSFAIARNKEKL